MATSKNNKRFSLAEQLKAEGPVTESKVTGLSGIFSEEPVDLDTFLRDRKYMGMRDLKLGEYQYGFIRHMEQIYLPEIYPLMVEEFGEYWNPVRYINYVYTAWGKGSGKDMVAQLSVARIAYLLLCLENPQRYYDLSEQSEIHLLNIAMNAPQAHRAFFRPMVTSLKRSAWFKDKLTSEPTDQARSVRLEKQIELISGHSQAENFEGLNPIAVVLDEISGFQSDEQKASRGVVESQRTAEAVYNIVKTSAATRFPENFKVAAISYPRYLNDPILSMCASGRKDNEEKGLENSRYYVDGPRATWDVNPRYAKYELVTIPQTDVPVPNLPVFLDDYAKDAAVARAKYECKPERSANRYMRNDAAIYNAFPRQEEYWVEPVQVFYRWGVDSDGARAEGSYELATNPGWQVEYLFSPKLVPMEGAIYGIHVDLSVVNDKAGIAMCHVKNWERREHAKDTTPLRPDYQPDDRPVVKVDFVTYFEADLQATTDDGVMQPREIQLRWARNLVRELRRRGFTIGLVTFDTYQSTDSIQILNSWGIESDNLSVDRNIGPYATLREVIYDNRLEGYYHEHLITELEGLTLLNNGKVDHPPSGSKDMADALCGAVTNALVMGGDEGEAPEEVDVSQGLGMEVEAAMGAYDPFWGSMSMGLNPHEFYGGDFSQGGMQNF